MRSSFELGYGSTGSEHEELGLRALGFKGLGFDEPSSSSAAAGTSSQVGF